MTDAKTVAIIGAGHSAIGTLIDLAALAADAPGTQAIWLLRSDDPAKAFGGGSAVEAAGDRRLHPRRTGEHCSPARLLWRTGAVRRRQLLCR